MIRVWGLGFRVYGFRGSGLGLVSKVIKVPKEPSKPYKPATTLPEILPTAPRPKP